MHGKSSILIYNKFIHKEGKRWEKKMKKNILPYMDNRKKGEEREEKDYILPFIWANLIELMEF